VKPKPFAAGQDTYYAVPATRARFRVRSWRVVHAAMFSASHVSPRIGSPVAGWLTWDPRGRRHGRPARWACYFAAADGGTYLGHEATPRDGLARVAAFHRSTIRPARPWQPAGGRRTERCPNGDRGVLRDCGYGDGSRYCPTCGETYFRQEKRA
jgi:hypothetical protein